MKQHIQQLPAYMLGLIFIVFGLDFFLHFLPSQPSATGDAGTFAGILYTSGFLAFVKVLEISIGVSLWIPKTRALGYILIAPIVLNIVLFELFLVHQPGIGILLLVLNFVGIFINKHKFKSIIQ
ncbi:MAG: hypothetical protein KGZ59_07460 [Chitinophagaceae bacterium]|nr:hypothetical protein [Chitinophagaceae bacterium]